VTRRQVHGFVPRSAIALAGVVLALTFVALPSVGATSVTHERTNAAPLPRCQAPNLVVWLDTNGNGAAGSTYYNLQFTNFSARACALLGFPGVSAVSLSGAQVGLAAGRTPGTAVSIRLAPGATSTSVIQLTDVENFPAAACHEVEAAGLRVYPPGASASKVIPYPFEACSSRGATFFHVRPVEKGLFD
jgi:hypothetical protein